MKKFMDDLIYNLKGIIVFIICAAFVLMMPFLPVILGFSPYWLILSIPLFFAVTVTIIERI